MLLFGAVSVADLQANANMVTPVLSSFVSILAWLALTVIGIWRQVRANVDWSFKRDAYVEAWG